MSGEGLLLISRRDSRTSKVFNKLDHFNVSNKLDHFLAKKLGHFFFFNVHSHKANYAAKYALDLAVWVIKMFFQYNNDNFTLRNTPY